MAYLFDRIGFTRCLTAVMMNCISMIQSDNTVPSHNTASVFERGMG